MFCEACISRIAPHLADMWTLGNSPPAALGQANHVCTARVSEY